MNKHRKQIEQIKESLTNAILAGESQYKTAVIRTIERIYIQNTVDGVIDINKVSADLKRAQLLPSNYTNEIIKKLTKSQEQIKNVWNDYFHDLANPVNNYNDYNKIHSLINVEFPEIESKIADKVITELKRSVQGEYGFNSIRKRLLNTSLGNHSAENFARTALLQFDNNYQEEMAKQAGVMYYLYDGDNSKNTRTFCRKHVGRVYTISELSAMDNGQGLPVRSSLGGYRCQHYLTPLVDYKRKATGELFNPAHFK